ncbi:hypothetical protein EMMF5_004714 [Cystobasidiomycetes sp. EMM_F5]
MKRQNLDGKKALSRTVLGASWIDSLDGSDGKTGLAMSTPLEVYRLSKREAESSQDGSDTCKTDDGSITTGCVVVAGVAVVFLVSLGVWVSVKVYRLYFITSPLGNENINGRYAATLEDWNKLPQDVKDYVQKNTQDPSLKSNLDKAKDAGLIADDPKTAEAKLRTYLDHWNKNGGTMIETTDDKNKLGSNYKVLDAATQAKLQADYPNTLKMQEGWANFDFVQAAQAAGLSPYMGTDNQIQAYDFDVVNAGIEAQVNEQLRILADNYNAEYGQTVVEEDGEWVQKQSTDIPDWMKGLFDASSTVFRRYYFEDAVTTGKIPEALADAVRPIMEFEWSEGSKEAAQGLYDTWLQASAIDKPTPETYVKFLDAGVFKISGFQDMFKAMDRTAFDSLAADLGVQNYQPRFPNDAALPQNNGGDNGSGDVNQQPSKDAGGQDVSGSGDDQKGNQAPSKSGNSGNTGQQTGNKGGNGEPGLDPDWSDASTPDKIVDSIMGQLKTRWGINTPSDFGSADKQVAIMMAAMFDDLQQRSKAATGKAWPETIANSILDDLRTATETLYDSLPGAQVAGQGNDPSKQSQSNEDIWNEGGPNQQQQASGRTGLNNDPGTNVDTTKPNYNSPDKPGSGGATDETGKTDKTVETLPDEVLPARKRQMVRRVKRQAPVRISL